MSEPAVNLVAKLARVTNELMRRLQVQTEEKTAKVAAVEQRAELVVQALLDNDRIEPHQKEAVLKTIRRGDPAVLMDVIVKAAGSRNVKEASHIGQQVPGGQTSSTPSCYIGLKTSTKQASDLAFERRLYGNN
jgi:predicted GIY-YIG superfamily endonuclease